MARGLITSSIFPSIQSNIPLTSFNPIPAAFGSAPCIDGGGAGPGPGPGAGAGVFTFVDDADILYIVGILSRLFVVVVVVVILFVIHHFFSILSFTIK